MFHNRFCKPSGFGEGKASHQGKPRDWLLIRPPLRGRLGRVLQDSYSSATDRLIAKVPTYFRPAVAVPGDWKLREAELAKKVVCCPPNIATSTPIF